MSEFVEENDMARTIVAKASGVHRDGFRSRIQPESSVLIRGILANVPTQPRYLRLTESGLPVVDADSLHLAQNLIESTKMQIKSAAMNRELTECIRQNDIIRVPCFVARGKNGSSPYHKAYMYIDAGADVPSWWPRRLNESGELHDVSYTTYKDRIIPSEQEVETFTHKVLLSLPESVTPDLRIDEDTTPGTVPYILRLFGMEITAKNYNKVSTILGRLEKSNIVHSTTRQCNWSNRHYKVYHK